MSPAITPITVAIGSLTVASLSLIVSITVAWLTILRRGRLAMTRPALIVFKHDVLEDGVVLPKVFIRTLLYTTGSRGHVIESMHLRVTRGETARNLTFWGYGETNQLNLGSGLRVGQDGIAYNHHFNPPQHDPPFEYLAGDYIIQVYADLAGAGSRVLLHQVTVTLTEEQSKALTSPHAEVDFEWGPDSRSYSSHLRVRPKRIAHLLEQIEKIAVRDPA